MRVAILGAGFAGLAAAYTLSQKGIDVSLFEKETYPGGLASGFKAPHWEWPLEKAYHHLFTSDWHARNLLIEIGMGKKLFFKRPITASLYGENQESLTIYQFDSPLSLLQFPLLSLADRLLTGAVLAYLKITPYWQDFEKTTAKEWLLHNMGKQVYQTLWEPILVGKFGSWADKINMAWFWARIKKRSMQLGYIEGGFQSFAETIVQRIKKQGGIVYLGTEVTSVLRENAQWRIETTQSKDQRLKTKDQRPTLRLHSGQATKDHFDIVLSTLPTPIFIKLFPQLPASYTKQLQSIPHLHALNLVLELAEPFLPPVTEHRSASPASFDSTRRAGGQPTTDHQSRPYWLNICNPSWPFLALVEHTNFIDPKYYGNNRLLYIGNYLPREHVFFKKSKEELLEVFKPYLSSLNPHIHHSSFIINSFLFVGPFAQPVVEVNYSRIRPPLTTPIPTLYMANLDSVYPWDRGTNYAIELGQTAAKFIVK